MVLDKAVIDKLKETTANLKELGVRDIALPVDTVNELIQNTSAPLREGITGDTHNKIIKAISDNINVAVSSLISTLQDPDEYRFVVGVSSNEVYVDSMKLSEPLKECISVRLHNQILPKVDTILDTL